MKLLRYLLICFIVKMVIRMKVKPIFNSYIAKQLVKSGNKIIDLQPDKNRINAIIFYFEETEKLISDLIRITNTK